MAFTPRLRIKTQTREAQDAKSFRIWDETIWETNDPDDVTTAVISIKYYDTFGMEQQAQDYILLEDGGDTTKWDEYMSRDGVKIDVGDVLPEQERFIDGYYIIRLTVTDEVVPTPNTRYYDDHQAFLAKLRCMSRKMPHAVIDWPEYDRTKLLDTHVLTLLLDSAEDAADLGKRRLFERIVRTLNRVFDHYQISGCW